jgi:hypothetical protein
MRLLDWTYSALVLLLFATIGGTHMDLDVVVCCIQPLDINFWSSQGMGLPKFLWLPSIDDASRAIVFVVLYLLIVVQMLYSDVK